MKDAKLKAFAKRVIADLERQHKSGRAKLTMQFHKLRMHPGSYKEGSGPPSRGGFRMPKKVPKGFNTRAAGIFGFLAGKLNLIKRLSKSSASQILAHVRQNPAQVAKEIGKVAVGAAASAAAKKVHSTIRKKLVGAKAKAARDIKKHIDQGAKRVKDFVSA